MIAYGTKPIILLINNAGYTIERVIHGAKQQYNDITPWNYAHALQLFGMSEEEAKKSYFRTETKEELNAVFSKTEFESPKNVMLVEIMMEPLDAPWRLVEAVALRGEDTKRGMQEAGFVFRTPAPKE